MFANRKYHPPSLIMRAIATIVSVGLEDGDVGGKHAFVSQLLPCLLILQSTVPKTIPNNYIFQIWEVNSRLPLLP